CGCPRFRAIAPGSDPRLTTMTTTAAMSTANTTKAKMSRTSNMAFLHARATRCGWGARAESSKGMPRVHKPEAPAKEGCAAASFAGASGLCSLTLVPKLRLGTGVLGTPVHATEGRRGNGVSSRKVILTSSLPKPVAKTRPKVQVGSRRLRIDFLDGQDC